jgi:hypothetical protein
MRLAFAIAVSALLVLASSVGAGAATSAVTNDAARGAGVVTYQGQRVPFAFTARQDAQGESSGIAVFGFYAFSADVRVTVGIDCLRVGVDSSLGPFAILSGVVVNASDPTLVGLRVVFGALDGGVFGPDLVSPVFDDLPPGADCTNTALAIQIPVENGGITISDGTG